MLSIGERSGREKGGRQGPAGRKKGGGQEREKQETADAEVRVERGFERPRGVDEGDERGGGGGCGSGP